MRVSFLTTALVFLSGCGATLSPVKRAPVKIVPNEISLTSNDQKILVEFERSISAGPLDETVWDNAVGPFADAEESEQIGFTQNYPLLMSAETVGGVPGAVMAGTSSDYTRIVIPFGRIFETVFQADLQKVFPNSMVADKSNEPNHSYSTPVTFIVKVRVTKFEVWEKPLNHLNLDATVNCSIYKPENLEKPEYVFETRQAITSRSMGSVMSTSAGFIRNMNAISNQFASELSQKILESLSANLGQRRLPSAITGL